MEYLMQYWYLIVVGLQVLCAVHALRNGRPYWWLLFIIFLPVVGCLVYFFVEMLPELRGSGTFRRAGGDLRSLVDPGWNVRRLEEQLRMSDTFKNRQLLGQAYAEAGHYDEAIGLFQRCLDGVYKDDAPTLFDLAKVYFAKGDYPRARETLVRLEAASATFQASERQLLLAKSAEAQGETETALRLYAVLSKQYAGEEARCRYAMLLKKTGQADKAREVFQEILLNARWSPGYYRRTQREWISIAKQNV